MMAAAGAAAAVKEEENKLSNNTAMVGNEQTNTMLRTKTLIMASLLEALEAFCATIAIAITITIIIIKAGKQAAVKDFTTATPYDQLPVKVQIMLSIYTVIIIRCDQIVSDRWQSVRSCTSAFI